MCTGQSRSEVKKKKREMSAQGYVPLGPSATAEVKCEHATAFVMRTIAAQRVAPNGWDRKTYMRNYMRRYRSNQKLCRRMCRALQGIRQHVPWCRRTYMRQYMRTYRRRNGQ